MKILLDECINKKLAAEFPEHTVKTVSNMGWRSLQNGNLLTQAQASFDVLITVDKNMKHQQNIAKYDIAVIVLDVYRIDILHLLPLVPQIKEALNRIQNKELIIIE